VIANKKIDAEPGWGDNPWGGKEEDNDNARVGKEEDNDNAWGDAAAVKKNKPHSFMPSDEERCFSPS
jgi:hypothetical protein